MSLTIASFSPNEIVTDAPGVAKAVNRACCNWGIPKTVQAVCQVADEVHFVLRHVDHPSPKDYHIVPLPDTTQAGFAASVNAHFQGSTDIVGTCQAHGTTYAVFHKAPGKA